MIRRAYALVVPALVVLAASASLAQDSGWTFRYNLGYFVPTDDFSVPGARATVQNTFGVGLGAEFRISDRWGFEGSARYFNPLVRSVGTDVPAAEKRLQTIPVTLGVNYHFGWPKYQLYVGPEVAYVTYGDISAPDNTQFENEFTFGAKIGVDVPINDVWAFNAAFEYLLLSTKIDDEAGAELSPDPAIVTLGVSYRF
jgi:outer membrane protein W